MRVFSFGGIAAAGVVLGHWLSYRLAVPNGALRHHVLAESGHSYWLLAVRAAILLGLAGAGAVVGRQLLTPGRERQPVDQYVNSALRLGALQLAGFAAMEVAERAVSGAPIAGMFVHHLFVLGLAVQFLVACVGGVVVVALSRAGRRVALALRGRTPLPRVHELPRVPASPTRRRHLVLAGAAGVRGPPRLSFAS